MVYSLSMPSPTQPPRTGREVLQRGARVVVRYRLPPGSQPPLTDVVGRVVGVDTESVLVQTRRGPVTVRLETVVAAKAVPPRPTRPGPPHLTTSIADLGKVMASGWPAVDVAHLGEWLLGASSGFTGRANSVLPFGDPGVPLNDAVTWVERWYGDRGLPPTVQLALPAEAETEEHPLGAVLLQRGYDSVKPTLVMTAASAAVPTASADEPVDVTTQLTGEWLSAYARQRSPAPDVTERILTGADEPQFLTVRTDDGVAAVARVTLHPGWAGIGALWVDPARRRTGLGRLATTTFARIARDRRIPSLYLQVEQDNEPAVALYEALGFVTHHRYVYLTRLDSSAIR